MAKKTKAPKQIVGVKVPKALRRALRDLAASQDGRTVLIEALAAAGAALAAVQAQPGPAPRKTAKQAPKAKAAAGAARGQAADARAAKAAALEDAARSFTEAPRKRGAPETPPPAATPAGSASTH